MGTYTDLEEVFKGNLASFFEDRKAKGIKMVSSWSDVINKLYENDEQELKEMAGMVLFAHDKNNLYFACFDDQSGGAQIAILALPLSGAIEVERFDF